MSDARREWLVYVDTDYYPFAKIVTAAEGAEAIQIVADMYGTSFDRPESGRELVIATPLAPGATNRVDHENVGRLEALRDAFP